MPAGCARIVGAGSAALLFLLGIASAAGQSGAIAAPRTSVVIFSDQPMPSTEWAAFVSALRADLNRGGKELAALDRGTEFVRGDQLSSSFEVHSAITVYLHGNCSLQPMGHRTAYGVPLGWVRRVDGQIEPFAHVDCTQIGQVLAGKARWLDSRQRTGVMARAVARVILHEWIHIATQNRGHAESGIAKARFGVDDLMGNEAGFNWSGAGQ